MQALSSAIATFLVNHGASLPDGSPSTMFNELVEAMAKKTIVQRQTKIIEAYTEWSNLTRDLYKVKPDIVSFNEDGTPASQQWSKAKLEEKKKITDRMAKLDKAMTEALSNNNWGPINDLNSKPTE